MAGPVKIGSLDFLEAIEAIKPPDHSQVDVGSAADQTADWIGLGVKGERERHRLFPAVGKARAIQPDGLDFIGRARKRVILSIHPRVIVTRACHTVTFHDGNGNNFAYFEFEETGVLP